MSEDLGTRLKTLRTQRNLNITDAAKRIGISRQALYNLEAGKYVPNARTLQKLARAYGVSVDAILSPSKLEAEDLAGQLVSLMAEQNRANSQAVARAEESDKPQAIFPHAENTAATLARALDHDTLAELAVELARRAAANEHTRTQPPAVGEPVKEKNNA